MSPLVNVRSIVTLCGFASLITVHEAKTDFAAASPDAVALSDVDHQAATPLDPPGLQVWSQIQQTVGGASAICIPTGATFYGQITAPFLPLPQVQPAPSARVLDNMTLLIDQTKGEWKLVFDLLVHEKNGVLLEWKLAVFDREDGSPLFQFTPAPIKFSAPGIYTRRILTGPICGCNQGAGKSAINCDNVFLDRSRSLVIVLPQNNENIPFGYDAGCPDMPATLERSGRPCSPLCLAQQDEFLGTAEEGQPANQAPNKLQAVPTDKPATEVPGAKTATVDATARPAKTAPPAEGPKSAPGAESAPAVPPAPATEPAPAPEGSPENLPQERALLRNPNWTAPALGGTALGLRKSLSAK